MDRFKLFNAQMSKFQTLLADNKLAGEFRTSRYPIELEVYHDKESDAQIEMFDTEVDGVSSKDARLVLTFPIEGIGVHIYGRLIISDDLMNKIKSHGKKLRDLYLQAFFATFKDGEPKYASSAINEDDSEGYEFEEDAADFAEFFETDEGSDTDEASEE